MSYSRDLVGNISVGYINVDTTKTSLFDSGGVTAANSVNATLTSTTASISTANDSRALAIVPGTTDWITNAGTTATAGLNTIRFATTDQSNTSNQYINDVTFNIGSLQAGGGAITVTQGTGTSANLATLGTGDTVGGIATGGTGSPTGDGADLFRGDRHP